MPLTDCEYTMDSREVRYADGVTALAKHLTLIKPSNVTKEILESMLFIGNNASLEAFYDAIQSATTSAIKDSVIYDVVGNCAIFVLDVMTDLRLDSRKKEMQVEMINFVAQTLMGSKDKDALLTRTP